MHSILKYLIAKNVFQRDRRFSFDDSTVAIANFLQEWCDEKNKLVLISYDSSSNLPEGRTWFDLKLEGKGSINIGIKRYQATGIQ